MTMTPERVEAAEMAALRGRRHRDWMPPEELLSEVEWLLTNGATVDEAAAAVNRAVDTICRLAQEHESGKFHDVALAFSAEVTARRKRRGTK